MPDLLGVVFDPSRLGEDLFVFHLRLCCDGAVVVEEDAAGAGRPLVDRCDVFGHGADLLDRYGYAQVRGTGVKGPAACAGGGHM